MIDLDFSFVFQLVNFLITIVVLNFLLVKPIREVIKKRGEIMAEQATKIEEFAGNAEAKVKDYEDALTLARKEGTEIRNTYKDEGTNEEQQLLAAAGAEASSTLKAARDEINSQIATAMDQLKKDVDKYAQQATDKILSQA